MLPDRFWTKVDKISNDCWDWTACLNASGYGMFLVGRSGKLAHRLSYESLKGKIPAQMQVDHRCCNRKCVNPSHMEIVTPVENVRRGTCWKYHSSKTHCPQGHPYSEENTYTYKGKRSCRICRRAARKRYRNK